MKMSAKNVDSKGRFRGKTIGFRVSPEEDRLINSAVALSGLTKQDFIIRRLQNKEIKVIPNPKVYKALKTQLEDVLTELRKIKDGGNAEPELLEIISLITATLDGTNR